MKLVNIASFNVFKSFYNIISRFIQLADRLPDKPTTRYICASIILMCAHFLFYLCTLFSPPYMCYHFIFNKRAFLFEMAAKLQWNTLQIMLLVITKRITATSLELHFIIYAICIYIYKQSGSINAGMVINKIYREKERLDTLRNKNRVSRIFH